MIRVDQTTATAPYGQIREQLADQIRSGALTPGTRLPSVRQLAGDLDVAAGTVARAYTELESSGLITTSRAGTRVAYTEPIADDILTAATTYLNHASARSLEDALQAVRIQWRLEHS